jgi:hypothetical protein
LSTNKKLLSSFVLFIVRIMPIFLFFVRGKQIRIFLNSHLENKVVHSLNSIFAVRNNNVGICLCLGTYREMEMIHQEVVCRLFSI